MDIKKITWVLCLVFLSFPLFLSDAASGAKTEKAVTPESMLSKKWGIEIQSIRLTAENRMIDFRYKVLDPEKAASLFKRETKPYLTDRKSGKSLTVPVTAKVGPLRNSNMPQKGRIYWMFFGNPGVVKAGNQVDVVIGDFKAENLTVE